MCHIFGTLPRKYSSVVLLPNGRWLGSALVAGVSCRCNAVSKWLRR